MKTTRFLAIAGCLVAWSVSAHEAEKGAKALFVDSTSGTTIATTAVEAKSGPKTTAYRRSAAPAPTLTEVSGLMYYVELVSPKGEASRVTTDRVFRSGERILLHIVSSVTGDVAVYQKTPEGRAAKLFPDDHAGVSNARIVKGVDTILPSPTAWFRFDDKPGTEELTLVLVPQVGGSAPQRQYDATLTARYDDLVTGSGSKGLVLETDHAGSSPATYVVRRSEAGRSPDTIVATIRLTHR